MARTESSARTGSDNPEPVEVELGEIGVYPEAYEHSSDQWKRAYDHAAKHNNTVKACTLYAESHEREYEELVGVPNASDLEAEIARLTAELEEERAKKKAPAKKRASK
jgi:hypothetical protein